MRPGFWQILLIVALVLVFFHRPIVAIIRALAGSRGAGRTGASAARTPPSRRDGEACLHCGAANPRGAKYCNACGRPLDFIDV